MTPETATGFDLGGGAAFFLEKRAMGLNATAFEEAVAGLAAPPDLRVVPNISDTPRGAAAVDAAKEAISGESLAVVVG